MIVDSGETATAPGQPVTLNKVGTGTWYITNSNSTSTGLWQVSGGILNFATINDYATNVGTSVLGSSFGNRLASQDGSMSMMSITLAGGTLQYSGSVPQSTNRMIRIGNGLAAIDASGTTPTATLSFTATTENNFIYTSGPVTLTMTGTNAGDTTFAGSLFDRGNRALNIAKTGVGTWVYSGDNNLAAQALAVAQGSNSTDTGSITVNGGTLKVTGDNSLRTGNNFVQSGTLILWPLSHNMVLNNAGGATSGNAVLTGGRLIFDYTGTTTVASSVQSVLSSSYTTNFATGRIRSTNVVADEIGIGWKDDPASSRVTVARTYYGDANMDGVVNTADFTILANNFGATSAVWGTGDFNYDGKVNALDFNSIATNFGASPLSFAPTLGSLVPEPAAVGLSFSAVGLFGRHRVARKSGR